MSTTKSTFLPPQLDGGGRCVQHKCLIGVAYWILHVGQGLLPPLPGHCELTFAGSRRPQVHPDPDLEIPCNHVVTSPVSQKTSLKMNSWWALLGNTTSNCKINGHYSIQNHRFSGAILHHFCVFNRKKMTFTLHFAGNCAISLRFCSISSTCTPFDSVLTPLYSGETAKESPLLHAWTGMCLIFCV